MSDRKRKIILLVVTAGLGLAILVVTVINANATEPDDTRIGSSTMGGLGLLLALIAIIPLLQDFILSRKSGQSAASWKLEKVGDIFWLGSDMMNTMLLIGADNPEHIVRNLSHINSHAKALELDHVTLQRLETVLRQAKACETWDERVRGEVWHEVNELHAIIGATIQQADPNYQPNPK
jgi:hypothetical protein